MTTFSSRLKSLRIQNHLSQKELASQIGVHGQTVSQYERGIRRPDQNVLLSLCDYFNVSSDYLLGKENFPSSPGSSDQFDPIPVFESVSAGNGAFADDHIIDYMYFSKSILKQGDYFAIKVKGDSMEPYIMNGDTVIARKSSAAQNGDTVIAVVNGDEGFCKRLMIHSSGIGLLSNNPAYDPKLFTPEDVENLPVTILGVVEMLIRHIK